MLAFSRVVIRSAAFRAVYNVEKCSFSFRAMARLFPVGTRGLEDLIGTAWGELAMGCLPGF